MKKKNRKKKGAIRELNPGPLVPKTRIILLDQSPLAFFFIFQKDKYCGPIEE